ncbi:Phospholipase D Active site motif protein [Rubripirellula obstinata]|uniref:Phospholipase D Active site motif protein n=1 Tax=Rubripirellula obstinata TaxID=406547 RepID=A0A5B1CFK6_9BACT|nr:DISARM system phospholipase D-like protein DrmC [Rubripirellula obstinata]KAA1258084.1 Phospholipase D Active site motif protein [Rubripirellula obstinata]
MHNVFSQLSDNSLKAIASGLQSGRVTLPGSALQIGRLVSRDLCDAVVQELAALSSLNFTSDQVAVLLERLLSDRQSHRDKRSSEIDLVTSGPAAPGITNRDTSVVVREMFAHAERSVTVVGYAVYQGQMVFEALAKRMDKVPELEVEFFLNISRPDRDTTKSDILVSRFIERFKTTQWPSGSRLPSVYYDPRSVADEGRVRSSLHAKCVIVDKRHVFISSANFTEAGQQRNIEVGLHLNSEHLANKTSLHFKKMLEADLFRRAL